LTFLSSFCYNPWAITPDIQSAFFVDYAHVKGQKHSDRDVSGRNCTHMPNNAAAEKRMRQEQKRRMRNRSIKSLVKTQVTKARQVIVSGSNDEAAQEAVRAAVSELDRAAKKGVIHPNNAARRKSRLMKQLNAK